MTVTRYRFHLGHGMYEDPNGAFVQYSEYKKITEGYKREIQSLNDALDDAYAEIGEYNED